MDEEMEAEGIQCSEIDIEYEFDAPRYFELGRKELLPEARQAELWFETAGSYPPSPSIIEIGDGKEGKHGIIDTFFKLRDVDSFNAQMNLFACPDSSLLCGSLTGRAHDTFLQQDLPMDNKYTTLEGMHFSNSSFMKPTTSQLARQNFLPRSTSKCFEKPISSKSRSSEDPIRGLFHAAKRQKVAGGLICKVVSTTQQSDLLHKSSKKEFFVNCNFHPTKMRVTIPREPVLETARRAKTFRAQRYIQSDVKEASNCTFKALPLNRKILEAPSLSFPQKSTPKLPEFQEFKLKTSMRAIQRSKAASTSLITDTFSSSSVVKDCWTGSKKSECQPSGLLKSYDIKASGSIRKLNGINRDEKKFNFSTSKRNLQQNPLSELFNKLSLSSQAQQANMPWTDFPESIHATAKVSKENVINSEHLNEGILGTNQTLYE